MLGLKTRENTDWHARIFDGELDLKQDFANRQITVHHQHDSRVHRMTVNDFRVVGTPLTDFSKYDVKELPSAHVLMRQEGDGSSSEMLVDLETGFVRHSLSAAANGLQVNETFHYAGASLWRDRFP